jgi:NADPH2:quinone reductase
MTKAIRIHRNGEPDEMRWEDVELPAPGPGEVRVRHTAIALNYSDVNVRRGGFYLTPPSAFPLILGNEAAGVVATVGAGVRDVRAGERVAYVGVGGPFYERTGSYAEERNVPASCLIKLPDGISEHQAAALLLKGLTASLVINRIFTPKAGETILIHAAASGVGLLLCQWAKHLGATVIGTAGTAEKAKLVLEHGCDHAILYRDVDFVAAVKAIVPGGVHAVYDGVGKDTFIPSFDCTRPFGMLVNYGNASGHSICCCWPRRDRFRYAVRHLVRTLPIRTIIALRAMSSSISSSVMCCASKPAIATRCAMLRRRIAISKHGAPWARRSSSRDGVLLPSAGRPERFGDRRIEREHDLAAGFAAGQFDIRIVHRCKRIDRGQRHDDLTPRDQVRDEGERFAR